MASSLTDGWKREVPPRWLGLAFRGLAVGVSGLVFALLANQLSPRGLVISRDYYRDGGSRTTVLNPAGTVSPAPVGKHSETANVAAAGFKVLDLAGFESLWVDPRREVGGVVIIDARDDLRFAEGHVPGAWALDPFRPELRLSEVLPGALAAEQVVVYCQSEDCEDALVLARFLADAGIARDRLGVFVGGYSAWVNAGKPIARGLSPGGASGAADKP